MIYTHDNQHHKANHSILEHLALRARAAKSTTHGVASLAVILLLCTSMAGCDKNDAQDTVSQPPGLPEPAAQPQPPTQPTAPAQQPSASPTTPIDSPQPAQNAPSEAAPVSNGEIDAFVKVQTQLSDVRQGIVKQAEEGADKEKLVDKMQQKAMKVIESSGLGMRRYTQITQMLESDTTLQRRVEDALRSAPATVKPE